MIILGLNAYHGDSAACIVKDGRLIAAAEEERFRRIKHWAGFPTHAIMYCLEAAGIQFSDIDHIALNRDPKAHVGKKALSVIAKGLSPGLALNRLKNAQKINDVKTELMMTFRLKHTDIRAKIHNIEHHVAHLASAYLVSPYKKAAIVSVDGFGDFVGAMWGIGEDNKIEIMDRVYFPHSLGLFYLAFTQFLGFPKYGDEYKVMGLAAFGKPTELNKMAKVVELEEKGRFKLGLDYFTHHIHGASMTWEGGEPEIGPVYSDVMEKEFGGARNNKDPISKQHENIASSMQAMYEEAFFHLLNHVFERTNTSALCLAGGCAMNSVANGKIFDRTSFRDVYIQPAAGDAGGAVGVAYFVYHHLVNEQQRFIMDNAYWGPEYTESEIQTVIDSYADKLKVFKVENVKNDDELCRKTAKHISEGKVVGWFQGRMEWGPRALGNRSIVVDPRRDEMKFVLNERIKRRETFRPFAPSILIEKVSEYFERDYPDPFMIKVYPIKSEKRAVIPAVTHVDGTGRLQTVSKFENPLYWNLIHEFEKITGIPVVLNTSFNENEPIVCKPEEAMECFLRTKMDILVLGPYIIER